MSICFSCSKEPIVVIVPSGCIPFDDVLERLGEEMTFININNNQSKVFEFQPELSVRHAFFCEQSDFYRNPFFVFTTKQSDTIVYFIDHITGSLVLEDFNFENLKNNHQRHINQIDDDTYFLTFFKENGPPADVVNKFIAIDDRKGNQWILEGEDPEIFYCEVHDNLSSFDLSERPESLLFKNLPEEVSFKHEDSTEVWQPYISFVSEQLTSKRDFNCSPQRLLIMSRINSRFTLGGINTSFLEFDVTTSFDSPFSTNEYSYFSLLYETLKAKSEPNTSIFYGHQYYVKDDEQGLCSHCSGHSDPIILHEQLTLGENTFKDVYEVGRSKKKIYFNYDHGFVAYHNRDSLLFTLVTN